MWAVGVLLIQESHLEAATPPLSAAVSPPHHYNIFTSLKIPPVFAKFINENSISLILYLRLVANVPWGPLYSLSHTYLCLYHKMRSTLRQAYLTYTAAQARNDLPVTGHPKSFRTYFKFYIL